MGLSSLPAAPAQPNSAVYGFESLELFKRYTRESYEAAFGVQAADFDASQPMKDWFDSSVDTSNPNNLAVYEAVTDSQAGTIGQVQMSAASAASVNLPGVKKYPAYTVAPTAAYIAGNGTNHFPFDATTLSTMTDAIALARAWGLGPGSVVDASLNNGMFGIVFPPEEARRQFAVNVNGTLVNVGEKLAEQNAKGVGHPGAWDLSGTEPMWKAAADPADGITAAVPVKIAPRPVRALLPNETVQRGLMGAQVVRTDLIAPGTLDGGGSFTAADRVALLSIVSKLQKLGL